MIIVQGNGRNIQRGQSEGQEERTSEGARKEGRKRCRKGAAELDVCVCVHGVEKHTHRYPTTLEPELDG